MSEFRYKTSVTSDMSAVEKASQAILEFQSAFAKLNAATSLAKWGPAEEATTTKPGIEDYGIQWDAACLDSEEVFRDETAKREQYIQFFRIPDGYWGSSRMEKARPYWIWRDSDDVGAMIKLADFSEPPIGTSFERVREYISELDRIFFRDTRLDPYRRAGHPAHRMEYRGPKLKADRDYYEAAIRKAAQSDTTFLLIELNRLAKERFTTLGLRDHHLEEALKTSRQEVERAICDAIRKWLKPNFEMPGVLPSTKPYWPETE